MKRQYIILLHVAFWLLLLSSNLWASLSTKSFGAYLNKPADLRLFCRYLAITASYLFISICCFYSGCLITGPQLVKKQYLLAVLYAALTVAFVTGLRYVIEYHFFLPVLNYDNYNGHPYTPERFVENVFFYYFPGYFVYGIMYFFVIGWYNVRQREQELQKEKASAELTFLRSQINPHFLFNSINDIYSLAYQKSEQAPAALLKLSGILRYMLRDGKEDMMPLQNEVCYLEDVIELQRISAKGNAFINFTVNGNIGIHKIATLLLIAFVENAFKHGALTDAANPVEIGLTVAHGRISFMVKNLKNSDEKDKTAGIGLCNVQRRLSLIYPGKHQLSILDDEQFYTVNLELQSP